MTSDSIELEELQFYKLLTSNFSDLYTKAQSTCSIIVIPQQLSYLFPLKRDIFESHVYRPSPMYVRKHVSWNDKYEIEFDNNRTIRFFYKKDGVGEKRIKVLSQEDVRDTIRKSAYSILIIEQPLIDITGIETTLNGSPSRQIIRPMKQTEHLFTQSTASYESSFMYLDSIRQIEPAFARLHKALFLFTEKYVLLPKFIEDAIDKLRQFRFDFLQESYQLLNKNYEDRNLELASEIYITGYTYTKFWPTIVQYNEDKDKILFKNIQTKYKRQRTESNNFEMNANQNFFNELKKLDDLKSSYEKAKCLNSAIHIMITQKSMILDSKKSSVAYHSPSKSTAMSADETLPAFMDLICQFILTSDTICSIHLAAHEYYIEKFRFISLPSDMDYDFTTYRGAIEYLTNSSSSFSFLNS
ncbi:unnamed protein product [Adineta steineri]|uniref:VPS9 domain-containing protein n=1 Tax=Adineta steineri TaxID=433720 RepID=A0A814P0Y7_9BILA|nr:unnamed protein product [Adineta steineri]